MPTLNNPTPAGGGTVAENIAQVGGVNTGTSGIGDLFTRLILTPAGNMWASGQTIGDASVGAAYGTVSPVIWNGSGWDRQRTPNTFKSFGASAVGLSAIWTPAAGKKFRLMRFRLKVTSSAVMAVAGINTITLADAATVLPILVAEIWIPAAAANTNGMLYDSGWYDLGNGYLSTLANNVLNANLGTALTAGVVRFEVAGTEE